MRKNLSHLLISTHLREKKVFIDGDGFVQWACVHLHGDVPYRHIDDIAAYSGALDALLRTLMQHNTIVFVFDVSGVYDKLKEEKKQKRKKRRRLGKDIVERFGHFYWEDPNLGASLSRRHREEYKNTDIVTYIHKDVKERLKTVCTTLNICVHESQTEEADVTLARLHRATPNSCILANDTDFIVHAGVTHYYILDETFDPDSMHVVRCDVPRILRYFERRWNAKGRQFILAMQCCGSDYVSESTIRSLREQFTSKPRYTSWIEHTMNQEIWTWDLPQRIHDAANIYDT